MLDNNNNLQSNPQANVETGGLIHRVQQVRVKGNRYTDPIAEFSYQWAKYITLPEKVTDIVLHGSLNVLYSALFISVGSALPMPWILVPVALLITGFMILVYIHEHMPSLRFHVYFRCLFIVLGALLANRGAVAWLTTLM